MEGIIKLAKKLKALADRGIGGEKANAERMLEDLMRKHNLNIDMIQEPERFVHYFPYKEGQALMKGQIIVHVMGKDCKLYKHPQKKDMHVIECTRAEFLEIDATFDFFWRAYEEELKVFTRAFIQTNKLVPFDAEGVPPEDIDPEELKKILAMMKGMDVY